MKFLRNLLVVLLVLATIVTLVACGEEENVKPNNKDNNKVSTPAEQSKPSGGGEDVGNDKCAECGGAVELVHDKEPSCETRGRDIIKCLDESCGYEKRVTIDSLGHNYSEEVKEIPATCLAPGQQYNECTREGCPSTRLVKELDRVPHSYVTELDTTGQFEHVSCSVCARSYVKNATTENDYFEFHFGEYGFEQSVLDTAFPGFKVTENGFDPYRTVGSEATPEEKNAANVIAAMKEGIANCVLRIQDTLLALKEQDAYVIQFDVMLESYSENNLNSFFTIETTASDGDIEYAQFLGLTKDGYLTFVDETVYGKNAKIEGGKLELNTWYNIAIVIRDKYDNGAESYNERVKYDVYLDGQKLELKTTWSGKEYIADAGEAYYPYENMKNGFTVRISDGGYGDGDSATTSHGVMAFDNVLIYGGKDVKPAIRGEITFPTAGKVTVDYPTEIIEENFT